MVLGFNFMYSSGGGKEGRTSRGQWETRCKKRGKKGRWRRKYHLGTNWRHKEQSGMGEGSGGGKDAEHDRLQGGPRNHWEGPKQREFVMLKENAKRGTSIHRSRAFCEFWETES